jgi:Soluble lytic murein transglycosylase and related regulatory proteins (some contain LysM/invasin domains)
MNRKILIVNYIFFTFFLITSNACAQNPVLEQNVSQHVTPAKIPQTASFAGEKVPLEYFDVRESLQRELTTLTYQHGSITYIIQLAGRYQERIEKILKEEGLHPDFFYLCIAESMLQPLISPAGANGYWQFLAATAKQYGLVVNREIDERYNIEKSTRAACKYFKKAYEKFGTWTLAAASYNIGMNNIEDRIGYQSIKNYYDMQLPIETARYIYRAIAYKTIMNNPQKYGFDISEEDIFKPFKYKTVEVRGAIANWSEFAAKHNTNFKLLKMYNEWIRSNKLDNKENRTYQVAVPEMEYRKVWTK